MLERKGGWNLQLRERSSSFAASPCLRRGLPYGLYGRFYYGRLVGQPVLGKALLNVCGPLGDSMRPSVLAVFTLLSVSACSSRDTATAPAAAAGA